MNTSFKFAAASVLALAIANPSVAQTTLTGVSGLNDRIDNITEAAQDDLDRGNDAERFGPLNVPQGWRGSLAFSGSATDGSTRTGDLSLATRLTYGAGKWSHTVGAAGEFGRTGATRTKEEFFGTYEANRYFSNSFYGFALGRYQYNGFAPTEHDAFVGFGPGYRILNSEKVTWRVQAGPGVRYVKTSTGATTTEASGIASSRIYFALNDTMSITNDTDVLYSNFGTSATNDLGLNMKVTDALSTRFSYQTDYNSTGAQQFENKIGVSLVVGF